MNAWHLLQVLKDARDEGLWQEQRAIVEEIGVDAEYVRESMPAYYPFKPYRWTPDELDDEDDEAETVEQFRSRIGAKYREWQRVDWCAWRKRGSASSLTSLAHIYKAHYNDDAIAIMTTREHPTYAMIGKSGTSDADSIEMRIRSYGNFIQPIAYGVFDVDGDDE